MKKVRITILVENTVGRGPGLLAEHGLSYWIDYNGERRILFDTGQSAMLAGNAFKLGIPIYELDTLILSHGHYDHTGGVAEVLKTRRPVSIYLHPEAFSRRYIRRHDGTASEIGMPYPAEKAIRELCNQIVFTSEPAVVVGDLTVTGPIPRITDYEDTGGEFFLDRTCTRVDLLEDDQAVFFGTTRGTVVLLGCAHAGVINTLKYVQKLTSNCPIHAVIGGMHLLTASSERIDRTIEELHRLGVEQVMPAHCTGTTATMALWNAFQKEFQPCPVGTQFEFDV